MSWTTQSIPLFQLTSGESLNLKTYTLKNGHGPHIHIQASVHGAELQGNAIILRLMEELKEINIKGSITFVPMANPLAINTKQGVYTAGRFNPHTGDNWNRNYIDIINKSSFDLSSFCQKHRKSSWEIIKDDFKKELENILNEYINELEKDFRLSENNHLNLELQKLAAKADGVLDLHTGPHATEYLYCSDYAYEKARYLNFPYVLFMPSVFAGAMDEACFTPWVSVINEFKKQGIDFDLDIESFTLEFGSEEIFDMTAQEKQLQGILNYLRFKGVIEGEVESYPSRSCDLKDYKTYHAPIGGLINFIKTPGEVFKKGDLLYEIYNFQKLDPANPISSSVYKVTALSDGIVINHCTSCAIQKGMEVYQVMTEYNLNG